MFDLNFLIASVVHIPSCLAYRYILFFLSFESFFLEKGVYIFRSKRIFKILKI